MSITRHPAIEAYFTSETGTDVGTLNTVFTQDATVLDEGKTIVGIDAITAWRAAAKAKYQYTAEPVDSQEDEAKSVISVRLIIAICWSRLGSTVSPDISGLSTDWVST